MIGKGRDMRDNSRVNGQKSSKIANWKEKIFSLVWAVPFALAVVVAPDISSAASNKIGSFTVVAGSVDALREQKDAPVAAEIGMDAFLQDVVRTKHRSRTQLRFIDNSVLNMGADHMVKIKEYVYDEDSGTRKAILSMLRGTVRATVAKLGVDGDTMFEVETPTAVASVRGTDFIVKVNSSMQTEIVVLEGAVAVHNVNPKIQGVVMVKAGQKTVIDKNKAPSPVVPVPVQMQEVLIAETTPASTGVGSGAATGAGSGAATGTGSDTATGTGSGTATGTGSGTATGAAAAASDVNAALQANPSASGPAPAPVPAVVAATPIAPPPPPPVALPTPTVQPVIVANQAAPQATAPPPVQPLVTQAVPALVTPTVPVTLNLVF